MKVCKVGGGSEDREQLHCGLQFRIGHQRQIDQALDRAPGECPPDRVVFRLDLRRGRVRRHLDAEQTQARECAIDCFGIFRLACMELAFRWKTDPGSTFETPCCASSAISCSAFSELPLRNSHSARSSRRPNVNAYWL